MYRKVEWMKPADQSILQLLAPPKKIELTSSNIARNTGLERSYVSKRLRVLAERGLVDKSKEEGSHPFYSISRTGEKLLAGEIAPEDVEN